MTGSASLSVLAPSLTVSSIVQDRMTWAAPWLLSEFREN